MVFHLADAGGWLQTLVAQYLPKAQTSLGVDRASHCWLVELLFFRNKMLGVSQSNLHLLIRTCFNPCGLQQPLVAWQLDSRAQRRGDSRKCATPKQSDCLLQRREVLARCRHCSETNMPTFVQQAARSQLCPRNLRITEAIGSLFPQPCCSNSPRASCLPTLVRGAH